LSASHVQHRSSRSLETHLRSLPPEEAVPHLLKGLHHSLRQLIDEGLRRERIDMSLSHLVTLFTVDAEPGLAGAELARRSAVTAQTMNTILHRMERDGQLERRPHPSNSRADSWFVTAHGSKQLDHAKVIGKRVWRRMLSALAASEVTQLQSLLQRCLDGLDQQVRAGRPSKRASTTSRGSAARTGRKRAAA